MYKIYKYQINEIGKTTIENMPIGAKILTVRRQKKEGVFIWALVDTNSSSCSNRTFYSYMTGREVPNNVAEKGVFIGTVQNYEIWFVVHVFEMID